MSLPSFQPLPLAYARAPFSHSDWLFEIKWDGFRALLYSDSDGVSLVSRNGDTFKSFSGLCEGLTRDLKGRRCVLDGEIVCLNYTGHERLVVKMPYCSECTIGEDAGPSHTITTRQRMARVIAGFLWLTLAWFFLLMPIPAVAWPLAILAGWFGASHIIAGCIGYPDCPELGAIATLVTRRYISTRCGPWVRLDRWLESRN